jgi:hypothetical protein
MALTVISVAAITASSVDRDTARGLLKLDPELRRRVSWKDVRAAGRLQCRCERRS